MGAHRPREAGTRALAVAAGAFAASVFGLAWVQGVDAFPGDCGIVRWEPLRALPWFGVALVSPFVYALVGAFERRHRSGTVTVGEGPYRQSVVDPRLKRALHRGHRYAHVFFVVVALTVAVVQARRWVCPKLPATCQAATRRIVIVGVGAHHPELTSDLVSHFRDCYGLPVALGRAVEVPRSAWNADRQQWTAEDLLDAMPSEPDVLTIGVTSEDIYTSQESWRYAFGTRDSQRHKAILSTHRMPWNGARKYVARMIAFEYCALPRVNDPTSVRASSLMGPDDILAIDESVW